MKRSQNLSALILAAAVGAPSAASAQSAAASVLTPGAPAQGELTAEDPIDELRGQPADTWTFVGTAGEGVEITLGSDVVDTYLIVRDPSGAVVAEDDDGAGNLDSRVRFRIAADGRYSVSATSYGGGTGPYAITLDNVDASQMPDPTRAIVDATASIGDTLAGELAPSDAIYRDRDTFADTYRFDAEAGQPLEIRMMSDAFDTFLALVGPTGEVVMTDDDGGTGTDSRIRTVAPIAGSYRVVATSYGQESVGAYDVSISGEHTSPTDGATELSLDATANGQLVDGRATFFFEGSASQPYLVDVMSDEFDTYVEVLDANEWSIGSDDDGGDNTNSRARVTPNADGPVLVVVTAYSGDETGAFTVSISEPEPVEVDPRSLRVGRAVEGTLNGDDIRSPSAGTLLDVYTLDVDAGDQLTVQLAGGGGDEYNEWGEYVGGGVPNLRVFSPIGEEVYDAGSVYSSTNATRVIDGQLGGTYLITVGTWGADMDYTLEVVEGVVAAPAWPVDLEEPLAIGVTLDAAHDENDAQHPERGNRMDVYPLTITERTGVDIAMSSDMFDTYLEIRDEQNQLVTSNDDYEGLNSRIMTSLEPGTYHVVATQFSMGEGIYTLTTATRTVSEATVREIGVGDEITASYTDAASIAEFGNAALFFTIEVAAGQALTFRANAEQSDPTLTIVDGHGAQVAYNDDADGGLNSRISLTFPRAGVYTLAVGQFNASDGDVTVSVTEGIDGDETPAYSGGGYGTYPEPMYDDMMYDGSHYDY